MWWTQRGRAQMPLLQKARCPPLGSQSVDRLQLLASSGTCFHYTEAPFQGLILPEQPAFGDFWGKGYKDWQFQLNMCTLTSNLHLIATGWDWTGFGRPVNASCFLPLLNPESAPCFSQVLILMKSFGSQLPLKICF